MPKRKLFTKKDVIKLTYSKLDNKKIEIGKGHLESNVNLGKIKFKDKSGRIITKKVAIKDFRRDEILNKNNLPSFKKVVNDLKNIKLSNGNYLLPKMGFIEVTDSAGKKHWVQVTEAFVNGGKSKFTENKNLTFDLRSVKQMLEIMTLLANKGYYFPGGVRNNLASFKEHSGVKLLDLEHLPGIYEYKNTTSSMHSLAMITYMLNDSLIRHYAKLNKQVNKGRMEKFLINYSLKFIKPELKEEYLQNIEDLR